jgi:uncharacterized protein (DUF2141 family)
MSISARCGVAGVVMVAALALPGAANPRPFAAACEGQNCGTLRISVTGMKSNAGQVHVAVFAARERWLKDGTYKKILNIEHRRSEWLIENVPYGDYAVAVFHDENGNGRIDKNLLGIPNEPYGFSNNARRTFGPPLWEKARFPVASPTAEAQIDVR